MEARLIIVMNLLVRKIKKQLFSNMYKIICLCIRQKKNKMVFYSTPDAADNSWHLFLYLAKHCQDKKFIWICEKPTNASNRIEQAVADTSNRVFIVRKRSLIAIIHFCSANYAFTTTVFYPFFVRGYGPFVVNLWHGMPLKRIGSYILYRPPQLTDFDRTISTSQLFSDVMAKTFNTERKRVWQVGLPRNDVLLTRDIDADARLRRRFNIDKESRLFFWLPTYRRSSAFYGRIDSTHGSFLDHWDTGFLERLNDCAAESCVTILVKLHPADHLNESAEQTILSNVRIITSPKWQQSGIDLYNALSCAAGLISDVSSVLVDFMVTKRPVGVTFDEDEKYYRGLIPEAADFLGLYPNISDESSFIQFIRAADGSFEIPSKAYGKYNNQALSRHSAASCIADKLALL